MIKLDFDLSIYVKNFIKFGTLSVVELIWELKREIYSPQCVCITALQVFHQTKPPSSEEYTSSPS